MFNFLVIQAGSPGSFLCAHIRITAAKRQFHFIHIALRKSSCPGLPSPISVMGEEIKAISQTPSAKAEFPSLRASRGNSRDAQSPGMQVGAHDLRAVLGEKQQEGRDGNSGSSLLSISPNRTTQGRDPGVFRPVQRVLFAGGCFSLMHCVIAGMEAPGVSS